jgi:hypothetical protein
MKKLILGLAAMALSATAMAGPSWTYAELNYVVGDSKEDSTGETELSGYNIQGSLAFFDLFHASAKYGTLDTGDLGDGYLGNGLGDIDTAGIRVGIHPAVTDSTDLYLEIGYTTSDFDDADMEPSEIDLAVGLRSMLSDKVEVRGGLTYAIGDTDDQCLYIYDGGVYDCGSSSDDGYTDTRFNVGGSYHFTDAFSMDVDWTNQQGGHYGGGALASSGGQDFLELGVRWSFGDVL